MDDTMTRDILLSPPVAFLIFLACAALAYTLIQKRCSAKGQDHPDKYLPYSSGQKLPPQQVEMGYEAFFRLGLLFIIMHVSTLVILTMPAGAESNYVGVFYLFGVFISAYTLVRIRDRQDKGK